MPECLSTPITKIYLMKDFIEDLIGKLEELYNMYEYYMWRHDDSRLEVLIQDYGICFYALLGAVALFLLRT